MILSAGESRRMGSPKALLDLEGESFLDRLTGRLGEFCDPVIVVLGHQAEVIRAGVTHPERALFVENADYPRGQLSSLQCGLRALPESAEGVVLTLVDHPSVKLSTLRALVAEPQPRLAVPVFEGRRGHPIFFRRELIAEFLALDPEAQTRDVVGWYAAEIRLVTVDDPGVLADIDDPEAYRRLREARP
ncbi:MAG: nucleotidyltransferase family protein [Bryobacteraceae bacterium]